MGSLTGPRGEGGGGGSSQRARPGGVVMVSCTSPEVRFHGRTRRSLESVLNENSHSQKQHNAQLYRFARCRTQRQKVENEDSLLMDVVMTAL